MTIFQTHQVIQGLLVSQADPCLRGLQENRPVLDFQVWLQLHLQAGLWLQDVLAHHPFPFLHQNSVLEYLDFHHLLLVQGNLQGERDGGNSRGD